MSGVPNPPAFPSHYGDPELTDPRNRVSCGGMTLRDYFAGQVLPTVVADLGQDRNDHPPEDLPRLCAKAAYMFADAMLAARGAS